MVNFCAVSHDLAQVMDYRCGDGEGEYIGRMDACLSECIQAVRNRSLQRDQMVRYRKIVCDGQRGKTFIIDTLFADHWKTIFQRKGESFVPAAMNGIPLPTAEPVDITSRDDQVSRSESISSSPMGIPETSHLESNKTRSLVSPSLTPPLVSSATAVLSSLSSSASLIIPTATSREVKKNSNMYFKKAGNS